MGDTSAPRVRKHRLLRRVFETGDENQPESLSPENSSEEELLLEQRQSVNNLVADHNHCNKIMNDNSQGSASDEGLIDQLDGGNHDSNQELQMNDELSIQSDADSDGKIVDQSDIGSGEQSENESDPESSERSELASNDDNNLSDEQNSRLGDVSGSSAGSFEEDPEIAQLRQWALDSRSPDKHLSPLLCILRQRLLPQLPKTAKTFLGTTNAVHQVETMTDSKNLDGEFAYLGIEEGLRARIDVSLHPNHMIRLDFNVDGLKLRKSSPKDMWAHLCKVYSDPDIYKPSPVSVFYGKGKPKSFHDFFKKFIIEMNHLAENGIEIAGQQFSVVIRRFICDTQARDAVKNVPGHYSSCGCGRCKVVGRMVHDVLVFLDLNCAERTPEGFRNFENVDHHKGPSALLALEPNLDLIHQFILDIMHLIYLGVVARMLSFLMKGAPNSLVQRLSAQQKTELDGRTLMIKKDIFFEFKRKMQSTSNVEDYHAVDYRFFLSYCCPVVFKEILNNQYYNHCNLLHVDTRMLCGPQAVEEPQQARQFMHQFVEESIVLYGEVFCTINVHALSDVADDVERAQCRADLLLLFLMRMSMGN
ncbi:hypothetical protein QAD02_021141 [Eretmocerus hayati]|uniref:Uncharacterized protein n=1 Tax=Eretmocerus hayati TaxID=131215 RepID=A0ACC2PQQ2_9HYME|nr:hypothetical protein QAD02_021141 [Eretmocerus hayati]